MVFGMEVVMESGVDFCAARRCCFCLLGGVVWEGGNRGLEVFGKGKGKLKSFPTFERDRGGGGGARVSMLVRASAFWRPQVGNW